MTGERRARPDIEDICDTLADSECRELLDALEEPRTANELADCCDLPQTSTYRKLQALSDASLVDERTAIRRDGHHATTYVRDFAGVVVAYDGDDFDVSVLAEEPTESESPDQRLARLWSHIGDEL